MKTIKESAKAVSSMLRTRGAPVISVGCSETTIFVYLSMQMPPKFSLTKSCNDYPVVYKVTGKIRA